MWVASFRHVKQHICKVHEPETPGLHDRALALCLSFKQHLVRDHQCPWCKRKVWAPARHAQQCVALHQLCVAKIRFELAQDDRPLTRPQSGSRHFRILQANPPSIQATEDAAITEGAGSRGEPRGSCGINAAAQEATARAEPADCIPAASHLESSTSAAPALQDQWPLRGGQTHGQGVALSRGPAGCAADGQGLRPLHASSQCHSQPPRHFRGAACQERGGSRGPHLLTAHSSTSVFGQGNACSGSENGFDLRGSGKASANEVDGSRSAMDFSTAVSQDKETRGRRTQSWCASSPSCSRTFAEI